MNETVKAALLAERRDALYELTEREMEVSHARRRLATAESRVPDARDRVADVEAFLRDNGVDLAAVDGEAERARPKPNLLPAYADTYGLANQPNANYANALGSVNTGYGRTLSSLDADPAAGLVKALDEA